jgi:NAD(P)-dependent dehydrogenase (short-subunit alcohol dehydrogenase family)
MQQLQHKTVIIIGGSSGIGMAAAAQAYALGASVYLTSRQASRAIQAANSIDAKVKGLPLDINDDKAVQEFFAELEYIDHIYIAAGSTKVVTVTEGDLSEHMRSFDERLLGSLRVVRAAAAKMNAGGSITFTGGVSTDRPIAGAWVAGLGTAAVEQLARAMVMELPHIRFNAVAPGYTDTPMWDTVAGPHKKQMLDEVATKLPVKKVATPDEVAAAVIFMMGNDSITGEVIHVDGGARLI